MYVIIYIYVDYMWYMSSMYPSSWAMKKRYLTNPDLVLNRHLNDFLTSGLIARMQDRFEAWPKMVVRGMHNFIADRPTERSQKKLENVNYCDLL